MPKSTEDTAWLSDFQELLNRPDERLPPGRGWVTVDDLCAACGRKPGNNKVFARVAALVVSGQYDKFDGSQYDPVRRKVFRQVWYRPASKTRTPSLSSDKPPRNATRASRTSQAKRASAPR